MMGYLDADQILAADDVTYEDHDVPEWGGQVRVRGLTATERDRLEFAMTLARKNPDKADVRAQIVGRCLVDGDGDRLFTDSQIRQLGAKNGAVVDRLFDVARRLSGMGDEDADEAAEDFGGAPADGSPSG